MSLVQITVLLPAGSVTTFRILVSFVFCKNEDGRPSSPMSKEEAPPRALGGHTLSVTSVGGCEDETEVTKLGLEAVAMTKLGPGAVAVTQSGRQF